MEFIIDCAYHFGMIGGIAGAILGALAGLLHRGWRAKLTASSIYGLFCSLAGGVAGYFLTVPLLVGSFGMLSGACPS